MTSRAHRPFGALAGMVIAVSAALGAAGCSDSPTEVEFQVIEEVEFAASLGIDLDAMTRLGSGVYVQDLVVGMGDPAVYGTSLTVDHTGWLVDGTRFVSREFSFPMGQDRVTPGFQDGVLNMKVGGTRRIIVPPGRGYGGLPQVGENGVQIPGGSVLVYEVELLEVVPLEGSD